MHFDQSHNKRKTNAMRPATLTINLAHLAYNYRLLQSHAPSVNIMAVVKANAYGHGLIPVACALYDEGCRSFAVTDALEGSILRSKLADDAHIVLFSGIFDISDAKLCQIHRLTPVVTQHQQLDWLINLGFQGNVWLKVDTGMNRLGAEDYQSLLTTMNQHQIPLAGIMSHLACADTPNHPLNQQQIQAFRTIQQQSDAPAYSLLNSAGMIALNQHIQTDVMRPGIALYGVEPIADMPLGLKLVAEFSSQVMQVRHIKKGEAVSYAATWIAPKDMNIAIVALGYADGLPRHLSNQGQAWHKGQHLPMIGRVCMDYCILNADNATIKAGDTVVFFGNKTGQPSAQHVATQCQTIAYELFTGISSRVSRHYIKE